MRLIRNESILEILKQEPLMDYTSRQIKNCGARFSYPVILRLPLTVDNVVKNNLFYSEISEMFLFPWNAKIPLKELSFNYKITEEISRRNSYLDYILSPSLPCVCEECLAWELEMAAHSLFGPL